MLFRSVFHDDRCQCFAEELLLIGNFSEIPFLRPIAELRLAVSHLLSMVVVTKSRRSEARKVELLPNKSRSLSQREVAPLAKDLWVAKEVPLLLVEEELLPSTPYMGLDAKATAPPSCNDVCLGRRLHSSALKHLS